MVTRLDRESQDLIISYLHKQFPDIGFIAEEQNAQVNQQAKDNSYYFVVDPLDGTQCFVDGIPFFCVSFALHHNNGSGTLAGVIINPNKNEEFTASLENGAKFSTETGSMFQNETELNKSG